MAIDSLDEALRRIRMLKHQVKVLERALEKANAEIAGHAAFHKSALAAMIALSNELTAQRGAAKG